MTKTYLRLIFSIFIALVQPLVRGDDTYAIKPDIFLFPTGSCTDRCHVNYTAYRTIYRGKVFRHKTHSPSQGLECCQCHKNDAVHTKTHGDLIIQKKDCWGCHHKRVDKILVNPLPSDGSENIYNTLILLRPPLIKGALGGLVREKDSRDKEDCSKCHADVRDYINGHIQNRVFKVPDWMSQAVSCTDCHKPSPNGCSFKPVREYCIECHNQDYGLLYDAWKEALDSKIKQFSVNGDNITRKDILKLVQSHGMHNFRLSQILLNHD